MPDRTEKGKAAAFPFFIVFTTKHTKLTKIKYI